MWNLVIQLVIAVILSLLNKPKIDDKKKPSEDQVDLSTSDEVRKIPYIAGTVLMEGSNVLWANGFRPEKITQKIKTGLFSSKRQTIGHKIHYGIQHALCWGDNVELVEIIFDDKVGFRNIAGVEEGTYSIDAETLFTGLDTSGVPNGVKGIFHFYQGKPDQVSNTYLESVEGEDFPDYKNLAYVVFEDFYWGNNTILPKTDFVLKRFPHNILDVQYININDNANPVEILYDLLTESEKYGINVESTDIDIDNFIEVGEKLHAENMGMSLTFNDQYSFDTIKEDIEKHLNCTIYRDLYTGKWKIRLVRNDYVVDDLLVFDESNISQISNYTKPQLSNLLTEVKVVYKDKTNQYTKRTATAKSAALVLTKGDNISTSTNYLAFSDAQTAQRVAERDLFFGSTPIISCRIKVNRDAFGLNVGDVIKVSYNELGFSERIFRIREIDLGTYDNNNITLELIEDYFVYNEPVYQEPEEPIYSKIEGVPLPFLELSITCPIFFCGNNSNYNMQMITKYNSLASSFKGAVDIVEATPPFALNTTYTPESNDTTPISQLKASIGEHDDEIIIKDSIIAYTADLQRLVAQDDSDRSEGLNLVLLTNGVDKYEFISFSHAEHEPLQNQYVLKNVWRGLLDTIPKTFDFDDILYFVDYGNIVYSFNSVPFGDTFKGFNEDIKFVGSSFGYPDVELIPERPFISNQRYAQPLNAGNLLVNNTLFEEDMEIGINDLLQLNWKHRDRNYIEKIVKYNEDSYPLETGAEYNIVIRDPNDNIIKTVTTTDDNYTFSDEETINPLNELYDTLKVEINTIRNSFVSRDKYEVIVNRPAPPEQIALNFINPVENIFIDVNSYTNIVKYIRINDLLCYGIIEETTVDGNINNIIKTTDNWNTYQILPVTQTGEYTRTAKNTKMVWDKDDHILFSDGTTFVSMFKISTEAFTNINFNLNVGGSAPIMHFNETLNKFVMVYHRDYNNSFNTVQFDKDINPLSKQTIILPNNSFFDYKMGQLSSNNNGTSYKNGKYYIYDTQNYQIYSIDENTWNLSLIHTFVPSLTPISGTSIPPIYFNDKGEMAYVISKNVTTKTYEIAYSSDMINFNTKQLITDINVDTPMIPFLDSWMLLAKETVITKDFENILYSKNNWINNGGGSYLFVDWDKSNKKLIQYNSADLAGDIYTQTLDVVTNI